ncbi:MAG: hypothetical protein D6781_13090 [Verrucomicrobia bacterium]|nr:MAG: hypothetical protein D6781_13090 [Verrucomicrobiota bacterium]
MTLSGLQSAAQALINADAALAAFGSPLLFDPATDEAALAASITDRLEATGVAIVVGYVEAGRVGGSARGGALLQAELDLYIAESRTVAHSPSGLDLVEAAIAAMHLPTAGGITFSLLDYEAGVDEQGYILHTLGFAYPLKLTA